MNNEVMVNEQWTMKAQPRKNSKVHFTSTVVIILFVKGNKTEAIKCIWLVLCLNVYIVLYKSISALFLCTLRVMIDIHEASGLVWRHERSQRISWTM